MTVEYRMPRRPAILAACAVALASLIACGSGEPGGAAPPSSDAAPPKATATADAAARPRIVILGDSLTAGLGLGPDESYPAILQRQIAQAGFPHEIVNAGVSGDTSAGGLRRLDWSMTGDVRILVVALGANDGLRGLPTEELRSNLERIIQQAQANQIQVILAGMEAPPNFGRAYTEAFRGVYTSLAKEYRVALVPFLLDGVAGVDALNQADGIHPTAEGARVAASNVWKILGPTIAQAKP